MDVNPILLSCCPIHDIFCVCQETGSGDIPFVSSKQKDVCTTGIHFVGFPGMNGLLLYCFNFKGIQFLVKDLTEIHDNTFMNLLPEMSSKNLNQGYLQSRNLSMHEDSCQIQLYLKTNINIGSIDCRRPPKSKSSIWDLIQTRSLCICQLLVLHGFLETRCLLPKQSFPSREICPLKESVFKNSLYSSQRLNHICPVVVQVPKFTVMPGMSPPEGILF